MAIKKVVIHAGMSKTGSTSIQDTLFFNKKPLQENGFLYITEWGSNQSIVLWNLFAPHQPSALSRIMLDGTNAEKVKAYQSEQTQLLKTAVGNTDCTTLIVSGETLFQIRNPKCFANMKDYLKHNIGDLEYQVILYVREPTNRAASVYQQWYASPGIIKQPEDFLENWMEYSFRNALIKFFDVFESETYIYSFEDAIRHPHGLVGHFLENIGVPAAEISRFRMIRSNESRSIEATELLIEIENNLPLAIVQNDAVTINPHRRLWDTPSLFEIKGVKFDLPYNRKVSIQEIAKEDTIWLKEKTGIDYTDYKIEEKEPPDTYSRETIDGFINAFPLLSIPLKTIFLDFFRKKHLLTGDDKFKALYAEGSAPWKTYQIAQEVDTLLKSTPELRGSDRMFYDNNMTPSPANYAELFIDYGNGLAPDQIVQIFPDKENRLCFTIKFDANDNVKKFRLDPSLYASVVVLKDFLINGKNDNYTLAYGNHDDCFGNTYVFFRDDPQLWFECSETVTSLSFELIVDTGSYAFSFCSKKWAAALQTHPYTQQANRDLQQQLDEERRKNTALLNSTSWRMTQPLRAIADCIKKKTR